MFKKSKTKEPLCSVFLMYAIVKNILRNYAHIKRKTGKYNID